jgi:hypothetical protein
MVNAAEPVDFEQPADNPTQSAMSSALLLKVRGVWLDNSLVISFENDFIVASLPSIY